MHRLLALDTTTEACSVALGDTRVLASRWERLPRGHSARLLPMVDEVLAELGWRRSQIDAIGFARGPGSFTGVRIAAGAAQGLALGLDLPVIPISTLATLAAGALSTTTADAVLAAIDARMGEVYWAAYARSERGGLPHALNDEAVSVPSAVERPAAGGAWIGVGTGFLAYPDLGATQAGRLTLAPGEQLPDARHLFGLARAAADAGSGLSPHQAQPVYLRDQVAARRV